jgi:hypothetical protein
MIPDYLRDEIVLRLSARRLHRSKLKAICRLLEIDLDAALNPKPSLEEIVTQLPLSVQGAAEYTGAVPFEFETRRGNDLRRVPGRIVYAAEGLNAVGEIGRSTSICEVLIWNPDEPTPAWEQMPENALPDRLVWDLCERVLDAVIEQQNLVTQSVAD